MPRPLKLSLAALGGVLVLLVGVGIFIVATFDPNAYKPLLIETVQRERQRTLAIPGPISLTLFPTLGVKLGAATLSERNSAERFASIESAQVSLAVWPLLRRQVVVDRLTLAGLRARIVRFKDGRLSIDDLTGGGGAPAAPAPAPATPPVAPLELDVAGIAITDAEIQFDDRQAPRRLQLSKLALQAGRIAPGVSTPVSLKARLDADAPSLGADVALQGRLKLGPAEGRVALEGLELDIDARLGAKADATALKTHVEGGIDADLKAGKLDAKLAGEFDGSRFKVALGMPRLSPAAYTFDAEIDRLNLDRFRAGGAAPASAASAAGPEKPLDLSALRELEANGQLRIGALQVMNLKASQVRAGVRAAGGRVQIAPLAADLYQGRLNGSASVAANQSPARIGLQQTLEGIAIGPLLKDLTGTDALLGRGNVTLDVSTAGATPGAMTKALAGHARVHLKDDAVRGVNVAQAIRVARAMARGAGGAGTAAKGEATDFSELAASFQIAQGVAHNDDLVLKSPLLRVGGSGDIDLGASRLDYTVKATLVSTLEGQGGADMQSLRGQTVPVKLAGPFNAIGWRIDFGAMAREAAQARIDEKREALKEDAKRRLADKLRGVFGK
ncbi:MAG: AsmA family protein [Burkholderiales bacterium]|nr:AsmA family protein [Burkholderiales bacterium]